MLKSKFYVDIVQQCLNTSQICRRKEFLLHLCNTLAYSVPIIHDFFAKKSQVACTYFMNMIPCSFWLCTKLKTTLKKVVSNTGGYHKKKIASRAKEHSTEISPEDFTEVEEVLEKMYHS